MKSKKFEPLEIYYSYSNTACTHKTIALVNYIQIDIGPHRRLTHGGPKVVHMYASMRLLLHAYQTRS